MSDDLFDLHVHTTASDGTWTPAEVVREAALRGLAGVGITDHDTVAGIPEARAEAARMGIAVVPGVELGAEHRGEEVHVLGYFVDPLHPALQDTLNRLQAGRRMRMEGMLARLAQVGIPVSARRLEELAAGGVPGRAHVARLLVEAGHVGSVEEAFTRYLEPGRPGYVARERLSPPQAVRVIREAGGCAVLAHPGLLGDDAFIPELVAAGLNGIEAYYPEHDPRAVEKYEHLARKLGLIVTGGSDCHGPGSGYPVRLGKVAVPARVVQAVAAAAASVQR